VNRGHFRVGARNVNKPRNVNMRCVDVMHWYRAKLCVRAVFSVARCLSDCPSVRPSVRPSHVTLVYCIQTAKNIVKLLSRPYSPITPCILCPLHWGKKYTGWRNFAIFDWNCRFSRKRYKIGPCYHGTLIGSHRWRIDPCRFRWPWVTPNPVFKVTAFL